MHPIRMETDSNQVFRPHSRKKLSILDNTLDNQ